MQEEGLAAYPGYAGDLTVTGTIEVTGTAEATSLAFDMSGLEASASGGIHIHSGVSCEEASLVGGHFWKPFDGADPWTTVYTSDADGNPAATVTVASGYTVEEVTGQTVVVHSLSLIHI